MAEWLDPEAHEVDDSTDLDLTYWKALVKWTRRLHVATDDPVEDRQDLASQQFVVRRREIWELANKLESNSRLTDSERVEQLEALLGSLKHPWLPDETFLDRADQFVAGALDSEPVSV